VLAEEGNSIARKAQLEIAGEVVAKNRSKGRVRWKVEETEAGRNLNSGKVMFMIAIATHDKL
jgi:hypothetical protein